MHTYNRDNEDEARAKFPRLPRQDPRFPYCNQTHHCFSKYVDFQRCTRLLGEGHEPCQIFKRYYLSLCPNAWIEKWDQQIEDGTFPAPLPCPK